MAMAQQTEFLLTLNDAERNELLKVLEYALEEARVEKRRTEGFDYRNEIIAEHSILQALTDKVKRLGD